MSVGVENRLSSWTRPMENAGMTYKLVSPTAAMGAVEAQIAMQSAARWRHGGAMVISFFALLIAARVVIPSGGSGGRHQGAIHFHRQAPAQQFYGQHQKAGLGLGLDEDAFYIGERSADDAYCLADLQ